MLGSGMAVPENKSKYKCFLNESGVTITTTKLITPSHNLEWANISSAKISNSANPLTALLFRRKGLFQLKVSDTSGSGPVIAFETEDEELAKRLKTAMDQASAAAKG
jgi:hypothetical protein